MNLVLLRSSSGGSHAPRESGLSMDGRSPFIRLRKLLPNAVCLLLQDISANHLRRNQQRSRSLTFLSPTEPDHGVRSQIKRSLSLSDTLVMPMEFMICIARALQ